MVYAKNGSRANVSRRPRTFSFAKVLKYGELQRLLVLSCIIQTACYVSLDIDAPYKDEEVKFPLEFYIGGAASGLVVLAIWSDLAIKQHMLFFPIVLINAIQLCYWIFCLLFYILADNVQKPNQVIIGLEGFLEAQVQFYIFFMTPLRIADKYRYTQEVTPAGTIVAVTLVLTCLSCLFIRTSVEYMFQFYQASE